MTEEVKIHMKKYDAKHNLKNELKQPIKKHDSKNDLMIKIPKIDSKHELKSIMKHSDSRHELKNHLPKVESKNELRNTIKLSDSKNDLTLKKIESKNELRYEVKHPIRKIDSKNALKYDLKPDVRNQNDTKQVHQSDLKALLAKEIEKDMMSKQADAEKKRLETMTDEEIIQENLKELVEKKSREERKANGRLIAVIVAFSVIFLAIYHAWIRKAGALAGVLVPAVIMLSYGGWVVILAKRDKRRRALFEKHLEEVTQRNKAELEEKNKLKKRKSETSLHYENEKSPNTTPSGSATNVNGNANGNSYGRKQRNKRGSDSAGGANRDLRAKRPSMRQKLIRQKQNTKPTTNLLPVATTAAAFAVPPEIILQAKQKRLQRFDALTVPKPMVRTGSVP